MILVLAGDLAGFAAGTGRGVEGKSVCHLNRMDRMGRIVLFGFMAGWFLLFVESFVFDFGAAEIDEQTNLDPGCFKIIYGLRGMLRHEDRNGFKFHDYLAIYKQIGIELPNTLPAMQLPLHFCRQIRESQSRALCSLQMQPPKSSQLYRRRVTVLW